MDCCVIGRLFLSLISAAGNRSAEYVMNSDGFEGIMMSHVKLSLGRAVFFSWI